MRLDVRSPIARRSVLSLLAGGAAAALAAPRARAASPLLKFGDLYARYGELSDRALAISGSTVRMNGYMAPPLKPEVRFFVLTALPMSVCPFCESEAQWPEDIVLVYTPGPVEIVRYTDLVRVVGRLETGKATDPDTGFFSLVRIVDADVEKL